MSWLHSKVDIGENANITKPVILHGDLKPANIMLDQYEQIKITDFGLSRALRTAATKIRHGRGTPLWMAPEQFMSIEYTIAADVYSFGIILWQIFTQEHPFPDKKTIEDLKIAIMNGERPEISDRMIPELANLIRRCWHMDPGQRPQFSEISKELRIILSYKLIAEENARYFWVNSFNYEQEIGFDSFIDCLFGYYNLSTDRISEINLRINTDCLKEAILSSCNRKNNGSITMESFGYFIDAFGPLPTNQNDFVYLLDEIRELLKEGQYHGDISREETESLLLGQPHKTGILRFSSNKREYVVSFVQENGSIGHHLVTKHDEQRNLIIPSSGSIRGYLSVLSQDFTMLKTISFKYIFENEESDYIYINLPR